MKAFEEQLNTNGFAIIRGFLSPGETAEISAEVDRIYGEGLKHHATYRDHNLLFEILDDPKARRRVVLQAHWTAWISPLMEQMRRSSKYFEVLQPFLGDDIKQMSHQVHWKPPGAKYTSYRFHQDARFRSGNLTEHEYLKSTVTTGLAIDRQTVENGALRVFPGSHRLGYLGLSDDGPIMVGQTQDEELRRAGLDPSTGARVRNGSRRSVAVESVYRAWLRAQCQQLRSAFHDQQLCSGRRQ